MSSAKKIGPYYAGIFRERRMRRSGPKPKCAPFEFKAVLPMVLGNKVSGRGDKVQKVECLQEMSLMFSCFKKYDFNQTKCAAEIAAFDKCAKDFRELKMNSPTGEKSSLLVPGKTDLNPRQINVLLSKFPHIIRKS